MWQHWLWLPDYVQSRQAINHAAFHHLIGFESWEPTFPVEPLVSPCIPTPACENMESQQPAGHQEPPKACTEGFWHMTSFHYTGWFIGFPLLDCYNPIYIYICIILYIYIYMYVYVYVYVYVSVYVYVYVYIYIYILGSMIPYHHQPTNRVPEDHRGPQI